MIQASEAVEYHENFEILCERFEQWMQDAENQLGKHTSTNDLKSSYDIEEHYKSIEVL